MLLAVLNRVGQIARLAIFALAETMVAGLPAQGADPDVFDITLARMHWEKAQKIAGSISGTTRNKTVYAVRPSPDFPDDEWFNEVKQNKDCVLIHRSGGDFARAKNAEVVTGVNPKYAFQLKRTIGSSEWVMDQIDMGGDGSKLPLGNGMTQQQSANMHILAHFRVFDPHLALERLIERPNFRATKTAPVVVDGIDMVRIDFECPYPIEKRKEPGFSAVQGGHMVLDPKHLWCLKEYSVRTNDSASRRTFSRKFDYATGPDQFPILREVRTHQLGYHPDGKDWFTCESVVKSEFQYSPSAFEDREMTLSAFGLPEPIGIEPPPKPTPRYVWFLVAAGALALLAILFHWFARRSKTVQTT